MTTDMTDVFRAHCASQTEEHFGLYTTIRTARLKNGSEWVLASNGRTATAVPVIAGVKRDDLRVRGEHFHDLHVEIVIREGLLPEDQS
jgi:hypothetical protein